MKRLSRTGLLIISLFTIATLLCSCGNDAEYNARGTKNSANYSLLTDSEYADESADAYSEPTGKSEQVTQNRKIIEYINYSVETKNFDKLIEDINSTVNKSGGYIESSQIGGNSYYGVENRTAELKIRIPKTSQSGFSEFLAKNSNVVNRSVNTDDVTDKYIDIQSRIKALTLEKETLEKLLTQSANVSDTLTVYEKLTNVISEIESYQGKLNQMDNLIDYTTFTVRIDEVEKETNVQKQNWFKKTWTNFVDSIYNVGVGLLDFISFVVAALPYLVLLGVIATVIVLIIKRKKAKKEKTNTSDSNVKK